LIAQFGEKFLLVEKAIFVQIRLFNELENVVVTDVDIQVLVEHTLDLIDANQPSFFPIKQRKHIQSFLLSPSPEKPFFSDQINNFGQ